MSTWTEGVFWWVAAVMTLACVFAAFSKAPGLPHRAVTELTNWGQGRAPEANHCPPGTLRFETEGGFFIECYRGTN